jgi:hypothetical protein
MPCHSTPFHSRVHVNTTMHQIPCDPPLNIEYSKRPYYKTETDLLYLYPAEFLSTFKLDSESGNTRKTELKIKNQVYAITKYTWPSHLLWFNNSMLFNHLGIYLESLGYKTVFDI